MKLRLKSVANGISSGLLLMLKHGMLLVFGSLRGDHHLKRMDFFDIFLIGVRTDQRLLSIAGPWYKPALQRLGVEWEHITFGLRNPVEQWFGILKHRINLFYNRWPHNASIEIAQSWVDAFVSIYHLRRC